MTGSERIAAERQRQISAENWTPEHDDEHDFGGMIGAAVTYAHHALEQITDGDLCLHHSMEYCPMNVLRQEESIIRSNPSDSIIPIDLKQKNTRQKIVQLAEQITEIMLHEPDKNIVFDAYKLAMTFWLRS